MAHIVYMKSTKTFPAARPAVRLNPLNDFLFLKIMGEKGDEAQLLGFLNAVLGRSGDNRLVSVTILESRILTADAIEDKASVLDVLARLPDGTTVNIEVQLRNQKNMDKRSVFYWAKQFTRSIKAGQDYADLPNFIIISIIDYDYLATEQFHSVFGLRERTEPWLVLTEALEIHFINMVKWRKIKQDIAGDPLQRWLAWLDQRSPPELIEEVTKMDAAILKAHERHTHLSSDEELQRLYDMRERAFLDWNSEMNASRREGVAEGLQKGRMEMACKMKAMGIPVDQICAISGFSVEAVARL